MRARSFDPRSFDPRSFTLWPGGLVGRVTLVLLASLGLEFAGSTLLYEQTAALVPSAETLDALAGRLARSERALDAAPSASRAKIATALSGGGVTLSWTADPVQANGAVPLPLALLRGQMVRLQPDLQPTAVVLQAGAKGTDGLFRNVTGTLTLPDGSTMLFRAERLLTSGTNLYDLLLSTALFAGGILLASAMVVRTLAAPLRRLAVVAGAIGHGGPVHVADRQGPREVRQVARALNAMQARITALVNDRTEALAAVSHDLRTPIARLRLRVETLGPSDTVRAMECDLAEMEQMIATVLAYLNGERDPEDRRSLDLVSLLETLVDDATDAGAAASYAGPGRCRISARPLEIKRALGNLIENAIKYGALARVTLIHAPDLPSGPAVLIRVDDAGPGLPPAELERVFEPFRRVDTSRNSGLGGIGLGLAIVRRAVERDGGRVVLQNRPEGGVRAEVTLPVD